MQYVALIHKDNGSEYGVSFPDFPGCVTAGATLEEARALAEEALSLHLHGMIEDGETIPAPSTLDEIMADPDNAGSIAVMMIASAQQPRTVRVNVTLPEDVLASIDRYAREQGLTRSGLLVQAAKKMMAA